VAAKPTNCQQHYYAWLTTILFDFYIPKLLTVLSVELTEGLNKMKIEETLRKHSSAVSDGRPLNKGPTTRAMTKRIQGESNSVDFSKVKLLSTWVSLPPCKFID